MESLEKPIKDFTGSAKEYAEALADDLKLRSTEGLATAFNKIFSMLAILITSAVAMICIAFGLVLLLGKVLNDYAAGAFIIGGVFVIVAVIMYALRDKMFLNSFVKLFIRIFYNER